MAAGRTLNTFETRKVALLRMTAEIASQALSMTAATSHKSTTT
jgi:hypothetical protein